MLSHGRKWVHSANVARPVVGAFVTLYEELRRDTKKFFNYFRMSKESFDELLNSTSTSTSSIINGEQYYKHVFGQETTEVV